MSLSGKNCSNTLARDAKKASLLPRQKLSEFGPMMDICSFRNSCAGTTLKHTTLLVQGLSELAGRHNLQPSSDLHIRFPEFC